MNKLAWVLFTALMWDCSEGSECPVAVCHDFDDNTCAQISGSTIYLRAHHCAATTYCNLTVALINPGSGTVPCEPFDNSNNIYDVTDYRDCGQRAANQDLVAGKYPKECSDEGDCLLKDGSKNKCQCGVNGKKYCVPTINSLVLNQYWQKCSENESLVYRNDYYYWNWYLTYYTMIVSAPSCAWSVSIELLTFRYLDAFLYQGSAAALALTAAVVLG